MIQFLASVTGPQEALIASRSGADIIDLKNPADGALGAVAPDVLAETIAALAGEKPVSAVAGNCPMEPTAVLAAVEARRAADFVKIGMFPAEPLATRAVIEALAEIAGATRLVAVLFADAQPDLALVETLAKVGFAGVMLDTLDKTSGGLLKHQSPASLARFVRSARDNGLMTGLAGSLEAPDVPRLAALSPDYLGFRGALAASGRAGALDGDNVAMIADLIRRANQAASHEASTKPAVEAAKRSADGEVEGDLIFVRDFVQELEIGAYGHEYGRRQKVRFTVEARIDPIPDDARTMADIYSYDVIIDAIRALAEEGHTVLVEELATRLATTLKRDERVREVRVRVEKLDLGPGAVGVEIVR
ncbi:MAG: dihydroneopterin aldolase [Fulvimarina manganoxydans]|uniref:(5-formylfuran-3-yl)methyl phosphate synthase n=1 Tax=Fulvimarina manganoxydans TaxID=937218 RepID=UPI002355E01D|nr:(5-formylfuran-3-yl)methyl phosphate synthase [Fulvimarina manganoxydans]MCK5933745.1 dihydroneopterin aldolase [Fulvimarina manganoxydans]